MAWCRPRGAQVCPSGVPELSHLLLHPGDHLAGQFDQILNLSAIFAPLLPLEAAVTFFAPLRYNLTDLRGAPYDFKRASDGLYQGADGVWRIAGENVPRFEDGMLLMEPAITNKCENYSANPDAALTGVTKTGSAGGLVTRESEPDALAAAGLAEICSSGFVLQNEDDGGGTNLVIDGVTGNINPHTFSAYIRKFGTTGRVIFGENNGPTTVDVENTSFERISVSGPVASTDAVMRLRCTGGAKAQLVLNQLEESPVITSPIITQGASASRASDALTYANADQFFNQAQGMALITIKNRFNHGDLPAGDSFFGVLSLQADIESLLRLIVSTGDPVAQTFDSISAISRSTFSPPWKIGEDGYLAVLWGPTNLELGFRRQGDTTAEGVWRWATKAYSGAFITDDLLRIAFLPKFPFSYVDLVIYDSNKGQSWVEANYP